MQRISGAVVRNFGGKFQFISMQSIYGIYFPEPQSPAHPLI